ncbi:hypothetical protein [Streptomyces sp. NPDC048392]|uniref:hypothetical protein n=1 Tax=Streptomyces sp. NPDC048392 TaxID=3365543 RepID=UPI003713BBF8
MRVIVNENFKVFYGHVPTPLEAGQIVTGDLAGLLARGARKKVTVLEDDSPEPDAGGGKQPVSVVEIPPLGTGTPTEPPPPPLSGDELDIDAPVADVLTWVGEDQERAAEALRQEEASDKPRSTLVKQLAKIAGE